MSGRSDPALPPPLDLSMLDPALLAAAPGRLLALATDLLMSGDVMRGGQYLDLLQRAGPPTGPEPGLAARFAALQSARHGQAGQLTQAVEQALAARAIRDRTLLPDEWVAGVGPLVLLRAYPCLEDYEAVEREAAAALAEPGLPEPVKLVLVPGARALAWSESGHLAQAAQAAAAADAAARRLGFGRHYFAWDYLRALAGLALERGDLEGAEQLTEQALSISEQGRPVFEFLALLDRAGIWAARRQVRGALASIEAARLVLPGAGPELRARADELEAQIRLSLGDLRTPAELAARLPAARRGLLLARIALAAGEHRTAQDHLQAVVPGDLTPRRALIRQILLAAAAIERGDPMAPNAVAGVLQAARLGGFLSTVVTTAAQVTSYLVEHGSRLRPDPFTGRLVAAALQALTAQPEGSLPGGGLAEPLTPAELRVLKLLPTSSYLQIAETLYISRNTVKVHLRAVYQKLGVTSRSQALERAIDLHLL